MRNNCSDTGSGDDLATRYPVLTEEVDRQLCTIDDPLVVYVGAQ